MPQRKRTAILISGRGSNMMALVEAARDLAFPAEIVGVISNRADAAGLAWATARGLTAKVIDHKAFPSREAFDDAVDDTLVGWGAELVCLAGFMRIQSSVFVDRWLGRQLNIHPSLLPSFKGLKPQQQALDAGVALTGCTVHFVTREMDAGPIVAQAAVPVLPGDTAEALERRILAAEHKLYPNAVRLVAEGAVKLPPGATLAVRHCGAGADPDLAGLSSLYSPPLPG